MAASPIDAVITWVDGNDPKHKAKLQTYLQKAGIKRHPAANPTRYNSAGEIDYCVTSLLKFAPWIRRIYIITDNQTPALVEKIKDTPYANKIKIVDHSVIFSGFEQYLPTFNSSSILSVLWRIPDLADQFIFLNDDFVIIKPVTPQDFFRNNQVVLRGSWKKFKSDSLFYKLRGALRKKLSRLNIIAAEPRAGYAAAQELGAKLLGFEKRYFHITHKPHPMRMETLRHYFDNHPDVLEHNVSYRLRSPKQFIIDSMAPHLEILNRTVCFDNRLKSVYLKAESLSPSRIKAIFGESDQDENTVFACIQSLENGRPETQTMILEWLADKIGSIEDVIKNCEPTHIA